MQCCQCRKELPDGALFCKYCGAKQIPQQVGDKREEGKQAATQPDQTVTPETAESKTPHTDETVKLKEAPVPPTPERATASVIQPPPQQMGGTENIEESSLLADVKQPVKEGGSQSIFETEVSPVPLTAQITPSDDTEETLGAELPVRSEPNEDLVFDLNQILPTLTPTITDFSELAAKEEATESLLFDLDQIAPMDKGTVEESKSDLDVEPGEIAPEQTDQKCLMNQPEPMSSGAEQPPAAAVLEAFKPEPDMASPSLGAATVPEAAEKKPSAAERIMPHEEEKTPLFTMFQSAQRAEPAPVVTKPQIHPATPVASQPASTGKQSKRSVKEVLWRLIVIAAELGIIIFLIVRLFF